MTTYVILSQISKHLKSPTFINEEHSESFNNILNTLRHILKFRNEMLYKEHSESIDSFVNTQIDYYQRTKNQEPLEFWQDIQRKLIRIMAEREEVLNE